MRATFEQVVSMFAQATLKGRTADFESASVAKVVLGLMSITRDAEALLLKEGDPQEVLMHVLGVAEQALLLAHALGVNAPEEPS